MPNLSAPTLGSQLELRAMNEDLLPFKRRALLIIIGCRIQPNELQKRSIFCSPNCHIYWQNPQRLLSRQPRPRLQDPGSHSSQDNNLKKKFQPQMLFRDSLLGLCRKNFRLLAPQKSYFPEPML